MANEVIIAADFSKFGKVSHAKVAKIYDTHKIIIEDMVDGP